MVWFDEANDSTISARRVKEKIKRSSLLAQKAAQVWWYFDTKIVNAEDRSNPGLKGSELLENSQIHLKKSTPDTEKAIEVTLSALNDVSRWCEERKIPLVLLVIPHSFQVYQWELSKWQDAYHLTDADLDLDKPQRILNQWAATKNVRVVDLLPHFRAYQSAHPDDRLYFYPEVHMNPTGTRETARVLQEALKKVLDISE
jgi:hypothetical protein